MAETGGVAQQEPRIELRRLDPSRPQALRRRGERMLE
jgi:hypothetical protein